MDRKDIWDEPDRSNPYGFRIEDTDSDENSVSDDSSSDGSNVLIIKAPPVKKQAQMSRKESQRSLLVSVKGKNTSNLDILSSNNPKKVEDVRNQLLSQKFESNMLLAAKMHSQTSNKRLESSGTNNKIKSPKKSKSSSQQQQKILVDLAQDVTQSQMPKS